MERYNSNYPQCSTTDCMDVNVLYQECHSEIEHWLDLLESHQRSWNQIYSNLQNLLLIKQRLDIIQWEALFGLEVSKRNLFRHDLLFYLMICCLLQQCCRWFKSFCTDKYIPSSIALMPQIDTHAVQLQQILHSEINNYKWLQNTFQTPTSEYYEILNQTDTVYNLIEDQFPFSDLLMMCIRLLSNYPIKQKEEIKLTNLLKKLNNHLYSYQNSSSYHSLRSSLAIMMMIIPPHLLLFNNYINRYQTLLKDKQSLIDEITFWEQITKKAKILRPKAITSFTILITKLKHMTKSDLTSNKDHSLKVKYSGAPEDFVRILHQDVCRGMFSVNNAKDTTSIVRFFYSHIEIQKKNGTGPITFNTLLTYFKRANAGDL
nr:hypothetical protein [uncultured Carboxylicivirga sp.]